MSVCDWFMIGEAEFLVYKLAGATVTREIPTL